MNKNTKNTNSMENVVSEQGNTSRTWPVPLSLLNKFLLIVSFTILAPIITYAAETSVTRYFDSRQGAMALNYDTELYMSGLIHSASGYNPEEAASRAEDTRFGWQHIIKDCETYGIPVSFNICGYEAVFGDAGRSEVAEIDVYHSWHSDPYWETHTWYSDMPENGGNYKIVGDLSGYTRSYDLIYGGELTEQSMNSEVPFEISYHSFGHESLSYISESIMDGTFRLGVEYHKRIGSKLTADVPPWNNNPQSYKYPIYVQNGIYVFNRSEGSMGEPYEVIENLWIVPRSGVFDANSDLTSSIDSAISNGYVLANYSHPEDGFDLTNRSGFQTTLAYAKSKVDSGELWATTLSEIGRYWEAKSDVNSVTQVVGNKTIVDITLSDYDAERFGIPYLTFVTTMPNGAAFAKITVDYPSTQILNSDSDTVRVEGGNAIYTIYLNPAGVTTVEIEGTDLPYAGGVNINKPTLTIDSTPPVNPPRATPITIQATVNSTDSIYTANIIYQCNDEARDSKIMTYNGGVWDVNIGPFNSDDTIQYYVTVTDNSGRRERSAEKSFTVQPQPDTVAPSIVSFMATSDTSLKIVFSESLEQSSAEDLGNYAINNGISINSVYLTGVTITLTTSAHAEGVVYTLTVTNVEDLAGNPMSPTAIGYQYSELDLVGFWRFDEGAGTTASDLSGNGNNGTLINGPYWTGGQVNGALSFDGDNDYVEVPDDPSFDIASEITITAWINPMNVSPWSTIASKFAHIPRTRKDLYWFLYNGRIGAALAGPMNGDWKPDVPIDAGLWTHVALTYNGSTMTMYKNGANAAEIVASGDLMLADSSSDEPFMVGVNTQWGEYFEGIVDEVRIYNRALSAFEIAYIYIGQLPEEPVLSNETPADGSVNVALNPMFSITAVDNQGDTMDIMFMTNASGSWEQIGSTQTGGNGTYTQPTTMFDSYSTQYSWRVDATDPAGSGSWTSEIYSFTTVAETPQEPPVLSNEVPADGSVDVTLNPTLSISAVDNQGDTMDIMFLTNTSGSWEQIGTTQTGGNSTYTQPTTMFDSYSTQYSWRVDATDPAGSGNWTSEIYSFTTVAEPVQDPPVLSNETPIHGAVDVPLYPTLSVTAVDNQGDTMEIKFMTNASGSWQQIGTTQTGGNGTYTQQATMFDSYSTQYSWRVDATDPAGSGTWTSQTYSFTTKANSPPIISSEDPVDGANGVSASLTQLSFSLIDSENDEMDYQVTSSPDVIGGVQTGTNVSSGTTIQIPITGGALEYNTQYTWTVDVNDGQYSTNRVFSFTTQSEPGGWWDYSWLHRKEIIIDYTKVDGALTNFPVLISLDSDADLAGKAQSDGDDIVFADYSGTRLNHEIEHFDPATGELVAWVSLNSLSPTADTTLYIYYANETVGNQQNPESVWDSNFVMVHHLRDVTNSTTNDSTVNHNDGVKKGPDEPAETVDGQDFDGDDDYIDMADNPSFDIAAEITITAWINPMNVSPFSTIASKFTYTPANRKDLYWFLYNDRIGAALAGPMNGDWKPDVSINADQWTHVALIYDGSTLSIYKNGANAAVTAVSGALMLADPSSNEPFYIGLNTAWGEYFQGIIDEVRVSRIARSNEWISTSYKNQQNPDAFYSVGVEEIGRLPEEPVLSNQTPADGAVNVALNPTLSITAVDNQGDTMDIMFMTNASGSWEQIGTTQTGGNGTYTQPTTMFDSYGTQYSWRVDATDPAGSGSWTSETYSFTTRGNTAPIVSNEVPSNGSSFVSVSISHLSFSLIDPEMDAMGYTVTSTPDIIGGVQTGTDVNSGTTIQIPITGGPLDYRTQYTWTVDVNDRQYSTSRVFTFTTQSEPGSWWNTSWQYRKEIIIDYTMVNGDLTNFPVLISLSFDADLAGNAQGDGDDILFTDYFGTRLNHEIEFYHHDTGELVAWVAVNNLSQTSDTALYMYYGNAAAENQENLNAVWDSHYKMVQHFPHNWIPFPAQGEAVFGDGTFASVIKEDNIYHMYYDRSGVGHATSLDGKNWMDDRVVLSATESWETRVGVPWAWKEGDTWYMMYRVGLLDGSDATGLATSSDGINWVKHPDNPVLAGEVGEWDEAGAEIWGTIKVDGTYHTYYECSYSGDRHIGIATSTDLVNWTKDPGNPIMGGERFCPCVFKYEDYFYMLVPHYMSGSDYARIELYRDTNPTFYPGDREYLGPVKPCSYAGFDSHDQDTPCVLADNININSYNVTNGELWVYHDGEAGSRQVGLFISPSIPQALKGIMRDSTTNANHGDGVGVGGPVQGFCKIGGGYNFSGQDDYMVVPDNPALDITDAITLECWVKLDAQLSGQPNTYPVILSKEGTNSGYGLWLNSANNTLVVSIGGVETSVQVGGYNWTIWHDVTVSFDGSTMDIYIDGSLVLSTSLSQSIGVNNVDLWIGDLLYGSIDDVRISDTARSYEWISTEYNNQQNPDAFYSVGIEELGQPPEEPVLSNEIPADGAVGVPLNPTLSVTAVDIQGDTMDVMFMTDASGSWQQIDTTQTGGNGTYTQPTTMFNSYGTQYSWRVDATDPAGSGGTTSEIYSFTTVAQTPQEPPVLSNETPTDGAVDVALNPTLSITVVDNQGDTMNIMFMTNASGSWQQIGITQTGGNGTYTQPTTMFDSYSTQYSWRVDATDPAGSGAWTSQTYSFTTVAQTPQEPPVLSNETPIHGAVDVALNPTLSITAVDNQGDAMDIKFMTNASGSWQQIGTTQTGGNGTYTQTTTMFDSYSTQYSWMVDATDPAGSGTWTSQIYSFTTKANNPPILSNEDPVDGSGGISISLTQLSFSITDPENGEMDYKVTLSPDVIGGVQTGTGVSSGTTIQIPITGGPLDYGTQYTWTVDVNDGQNSTNRVFSFTTQSEPGGWWNNNWLYRKEIMIDYTKVDGALTNFPVLISLGSDADLAGKAQIDGDDIVFADYSGTKLNHEIEYFDSNTGKLGAWVSVNSLSPTAETALYIYYGNAAVGSQQNPESVWDSDFVMVQHLRDVTNSTTNDSTVNQNDGTKKGPDEPVETVDGQDFDGVDDYISVADNDGLDRVSGQGFSYTLWLKSYLLDSYRAIATHRDVGGGNAVIGLWTSNNDLYVEVKNDGRTSVTTGVAGVTLSTDTWYYVGLTRSSTGNVDLWLNGNSYSMGSCPGDITPIQDLYIGVHRNGLSYLQPFSGLIDEVRISNIARSAEWMSTEYKNQSNPAAFYSVGSEVQH